MATLGAGTKQGTTTNKPARLLDLSRLISRVGRTLTGVDRVEVAYLRAFLDDDAPAYGLVRTRLGYLVLDRQGLLLLRGAVADWAAQDGLLGRLRGVAIARAPKPMLGWALRRYLPAGTVYVNTGHSNLTKRVIGAVRQVPQARIAVLIHDTIPLDFPEYQAEGATARFAGLLHRACTSADVLIYNSEQTRADVARHFDGAPPAGIVAHLGIDVPHPDIRQLPQGVLPDRPYYVTIGTIEPRKAHDLLLDVWDRLIAEMGAEAPMLLICGARGWRNAAVFDRLDALAPDAPIQELAGLSDGAIAVLLQNATALLFPSHAEGFGLPPAEAAALGTPIVCNDLAIYREFLANIPIYAESGNGNLWYEIVKSGRADRGSLLTGASHPENAWQPPTWAAHFDRVLPFL